MLMRKAKKKSENVKKQSHTRHSIPFLDEAPGFAFVAGYTSWGFSFGTLMEEDEEDTDSLEEDDLPF